MRVGDYIIFREEFRKQKGHIAKIRSRIRGISKLIVELNKDSSFGWLKESDDSLEGYVPVAGNRYWYISSDQIISTESSTTKKKKGTSLKEVKKVRAKATTVPKVKKRIIKEEKTWPNLFPRITK